MGINPSSYYCPDPSILCLDSGDVKGYKYMKYLSKIGIGVK
jgi:hypothetical protein